MIPEHPTITNMERTGFPDGKEPDYPICPVCFEECEDIYMDKYGDVFGCDQCVQRKDAWYLME